MNANELADWIRDTEFYDNPNPGLNDKMDEVEAMLRQQQTLVDGADVVIKELQERIGKKVSEIEGFKGQIARLETIERRLGSYQDSEQLLKAAIGQRDQLIADQQAEIESLNAALRKAV